MGNLPKGYLHPPPAAHPRPLSPAAARLQSVDVAVQDPRILTQTPNVVFFSQRRPPEVWTPSSGL
eukprot:8017005-Pyramimonas_sp.AAC.1